MLGVDILGPLTETKNGNKYILVFTDYLSKWAEAFAIKRIDSVTVAKIFVDEIVCRHSAPEILLSDQGKQFMSDLIKEVCNYLYTKKLNTTAYHPQCNGLTERFNATLCQMLAIRCSQDQTNWDEYINSSLFAYRASPHEVTKRSPFEILFGRTPRLPSNLEKLNNSDNYFLKDFSKKWEEAKSQIDKINKTRKDKFDRNLPRKEIKIGDSIRLHLPAFKAGLKDKLRGNRWSDIYKVVGKSKNGNLKIKIPGKRIYITHPNRIKLAEQSYENFPLEIKKINPCKKVSFKVHDNNNEENIQYTTLLTNSPIKGTESLELSSSKFKTDNSTKQTKEMAQEKLRAEIDIALKELKIKLNTTEYEIIVKEVLARDNNQHNSTTRKRHLRRLISAIIEKQLPSFLEKSDISITVKESNRQIFTMSSTLNKRLETRRLATKRKVVDEVGKASERKVEVKEPSPRKSVEPKKMKQQTEYTYKENVELEVFVEEEQL